MLHESSHYAANTCARSLPYKLLRESTLLLFILQHLHSSAVW